MDAQGFDQVGPERCLVDEAGGAGVKVQQARIGRGPPTVRSEDRIGGQHVGVQLGITVPRGPVNEGGRNQSGGLDPPLAAGAPAGHGGVALEVFEPFCDRAVVGHPDRGRGLRVAQPPQHRDGLRGRESEVEPRHP